MDRRVGCVARVAPLSVRRVGGRVAMEGSLDAGLAGWRMDFIHDAGRMDESWKYKW